MSDHSNRQGSFHQAGLIFPLEHWHNHSSSLVECANGDLLVCWYNGSGERRADDVKVEGARRRAGETGWERFLMADVPGYPDCNPILFIDPRERLWLVWVTIIAHRWETALLRCRISGDYQLQGPPRWRWSDVIHITPGEDFAEDVRLDCEREEANLERWPEEERERVREYLQGRREHAADEYFRRMGWMPRIHPLVTDEGHILLPLYSDGFDFSLIAISGDLGETWTAGRPLISPGGVQPSLVARRDGTVVAYMRNNGPPPKRIMVSESGDGGFTWGPVGYADLPNPGASVEAIRLQDGAWLMVGNDTERGRHSLAVWLSEDEGRSWPWKRHLEHDPPGEGAGGYSYPSVIQARDGLVHVTYSCHLNRSDLEIDEQGRPLRNSIKHARFNRSWVEEGCVECACRAE